MTDAVQHTHSLVLQLHQRQFQTYTCTHILQKSFKTKLDTSESFPKVKREVEIVFCDLKKCRLNISTH